jgi:hypothetical protein
MPTPPQLRIIIEFEPGEPVTGWVGFEDGPKTHFEGLIHLISVPEDARQRHRP